MAHQVNTPQAGLPGSDRLAAIKARVDAATGGHWRAWDRGVGFEIVVSDELDGYGRPAHCLPEGMRTSIGRKADAEFIANARQDIPWLIAEIQRLRGVDA